jgi:hypothetical protein
MEYALLRTLRALGPGLILLTYIDAFRVLVLCTGAYFWPLDTSKLLLLGYIVGGAYGALTARFDRETRAFTGVTRFILNELEQILPGISHRCWRDVSPCFYMLIDEDKSLEQKGKGIYFNGFIVTTAFEAMWISCGAGLVGLATLFWLCRPEFLGLAVAAAVFSWLMWRASVKRHCELVASQVRIIRKRFATRFVDCVEGRGNRSPEEAG